MKKIPSLLLACAITAASAMAQTGSGAASAGTAAAADSVAVNVTVGDSAVASANIAFRPVDITVDKVELDSDEPRTVPEIGVRDGHWELHYDGETYRLTDLVEGKMIFSGEIGDLENLDADTILLRENMGYATAIIAIVFGIPCLAIVVGLIVILAFALKRNRARNELINNAIDHNYQLPDAFYINQKGSGQGQGLPTRDSMKYYTAVTLMAVGLSLIVFAIATSASFFYLAGGIPFLIGVGRLIGYYSVPSEPRAPMGWQPPYSPSAHRNPMQAPAQAPMQNPMQGSWQPQPQQPQPQPQQPQPQPRQWQATEFEVRVEQPQHPDNDGATPPPFNGIRR